ncbi:hypothetical protein REPUB_Repub19eG0082000 [Reevesia pubescens]
MKVSSDLGNYLGVPLLAKRVNKHTYSFFIDKVSKRLASWKASQLSFAGRATLVQAVTSTIATYAMQSTKLHVSVTHEIDRLNRNFLWGSTDEKSRVPLVKWDTVCKPKSDGGLGIRKSAHMNRALLAKLGWKLEAGNEGLWARVWRAKYLKGKSFLQSTLKCNCSHTWRSICSSKDLVGKGCAKVIGNGCTTSFWFDKWCGNRCLADFNGQNQHGIEGAPMVSDYISNHNWQWDKSRDLPDEVTKAISLIYPIPGNEDNIFWEASCNGDFSVSSAYGILLERGVCSTLWQLIWKSNLPPRIRHFLWLSGHNRLLTKENCFRRTLAASACCPRCDAPIENILHVLRDCRFSQDVWKTWLHGFRLDTFNSLSLSDWLSQNLMSKGMSFLGGRPWCVVFGFTCCWFCAVLPPDSLQFKNSLPDHQPPLPFTSNSTSLVPGGLFIDPNFPSSFLEFISPFKDSSASKSPAFFARRQKREAVAVKDLFFLSVSLSNDGIVSEPKDFFLQNGVKNKSNEELALPKRKVRVTRRGAVNTTKHLWAGAIAAMVSRENERLKLEYIVRGEQRNIFELVKKIALTQGLLGFWKGNLVNVLRTAPFKAVNFYAYDTYRKQLLRLSGNEETTNTERFVAGAAAGITATVLCLPLDTIRTKIVAPGGEALGGVIGAFRHMIQTEGFFSLYKGLVPSIVSMAPSAAVFYGVYDMLKSAYLHSPGGRKRIQNMSQLGQERNALDQLELGPVRTLLYGAIAGACAEVATYPFEVVRRQLQLQVQASKLGALATGLRIVEQGGVPALYAGLIPSLLQVLPSAAISYFVYEFMKIVLKVN